MIRIAALLGLIAAAVATPGFLTTTSLFSLLTTMSFIGCVAVGMTFITLSGNVMSFCLGATLWSPPSCSWQPADRPRGRAARRRVPVQRVLTGLQGWIVGYFRADPIIVSMAVLALIYGFVTLATGGSGIYPEGAETDVLKGRIGIVPIPLAAFLVTVVAGQFILSFTRFGRNLYWSAATTAPPSPPAS